MLHYENMIPVEDYLRLRGSVGWKSIAYRQAENAVKNCFYSVCCYDDSTVIGMARLLWNGDYCAYISDVIVDASYRGKGIASHMINMVIKYLKENMEDGYAVKLFLMAAKDRESFYEQFGFTRRPNDYAGAALEMWLEK